jgi:glycosyltransferase involved in cell wall biosynthesis
MGGVGIAPLEAVLCGTPVIVTEGCGEIVREADCGYLVEYDNVGQLTKMMEHVLENPAEARKKAQTGIQYITQNLSWERITEQVERTYDACIMGSRKR